MVSPGMRRYRVRSDLQATLVGPEGDGRIDPLFLFGRQAPLRLEIGCGHGEFIAALAATHPAEDLIGVEYDHLRVTKIAHKCLKAGAANVRIFQGEAARFVAERCPPAAFHRIYILFPDPWPKAAQRRRRLVDRAFLLSLSRCAAPGCRLVFASDTHNYAMQVLNNLSSLPGLWSNRHPPPGFRFDVPVRFPTVFERHKREEGCSICQLCLERSRQPVPPSSSPPASPAPLL